MKKDKELQKFDSFGKWNYKIVINQKKFIYGEGLTKLKNRLLWRSEKQSGCEIQILGQTVVFRL